MPEFPLILGMFFLDPVLLVASAILGGAASVVIQRR